MNYQEQLLTQIVEARELCEAAAECLQHSEHPSMSECGESYVCADGAAGILSEIEKELRYELMTGTA